MMVACENYARVSHVIVHVRALIRVTLGLPRSRMLRAARSCGCQRVDFWQWNTNLFMILWLKNLIHLVRMLPALYHLRQIMGQFTEGVKPPPPLLMAASNWPNHVGFVSLFCSFYKPGIERGLSKTLVMKMTLGHTDSRRIC